MCFAATGGLRAVKELLTTVCRSLGSARGEASRGHDMHRSALTLSGILVAAAVLVAAEPSYAQRVANQAQSGASYEARLAAYTRARNAYEAEASAYWDQISEKRRTRFAKRRNNQAVGLDDYVLTQPPVYTGPPKPPDPDPQPETKPPRAPIPVVADFLKAASDHYRFAPQRPASDLDFKRAYAKEAKAAGLTRDQIVRIYAFETGGNGTYDVQSGLTHPRPNARAISTAVGYNQLLTTNSVSLLAGHGDHFLQALRQRDVADSKIAYLRRMIAFSRTVPNQWGEHDKLAKTRGGLGIHAAVLDRDFGPLLQVQKLLDSVKFAQTKGHEATTDGGRARDDEPDRRRQWDRSRHHAAVVARAGADLELLPARRL